MSAQEIIEQIKALTPEERTIVVDFVHELEGAPGQPANVPHVDQAALESSAKQVFDRYDDLFRKLAQ